MMDKKRRRIDQLVKNNAMAHMAVGSWAGRGYQFVTFREDSRAMKAPFERV
jgi:hypothetical protein